MTQPEFFLDRCLGRGVARRLMEFGWRIHLVADVFCDDGQHTSDEEWISYGLVKGWGLLTQDGRIRYRASELAALAGGQGAMFCLSTGNLRIAQKVECFEALRAAIREATVSGRMAFYMVYSTRIVKKWP